MNLKRRDKGVSVAFVAVVLLAATVILYSLTQVFMTKSKQSTFLRTMEEVAALAQTGTSEAIGRLSLEPTLCSSDPDDPFCTVVQVGASKRYQSFCYRRNQPKDNVYYIVTSATLTVSGKVFEIVFHTILDIANISSYFSAVNGPATFSIPANLTGGKVYARELTFDGFSNPDTMRLFRAEYFESVVPATPWDPFTKGKIIIDDPAVPGEPFKLIFPMVFPQVTENDLEKRYKVLAKLTGDHTTVHNFKGDIYPPGFWNFDLNNPPANDFYVDAGGHSLHTRDNREHVYYFNGDIDIGDPAMDTVVHGQVLMVANGNIYLHGNVTVSIDTTYPGRGQQFESTANQLVLIPGTRGTVFIQNDIPVSPPETEQKIEALVLAPNGTFRAIAHEPTSDHQYLVLSFKGATILGSGVNFGEVFIKGRSYQYDPTLKDNPPPYLPPLLIIYNQFQHSSAVGGD
ncbi:MAG: hypothetical protein LHV69_01685 [Elusimicrobia bacterium]|nr:hypothetical protein [Candidatus Obscuribacterium magneticum]